MRNDWFRRLVFKVSWIVKLLWFDYMLRKTRKETLLRHPYPPTIASRSALFLNLFDVSNLCSRSLHWTCPFSNIKRFRSLGIHCEQRTSYLIENRISDWKLTSEKITFELLWSSLFKDENVNETLASFTISSVTRKLPSLPDRGPHINAKLPIVRFQ